MIHAENERSAPASSTWDRLPAYGVSRLVVAEIQRPGVAIGSEQKDQAWRYVKELRSKGLVTEAAKITCYVLGSRIDADESAPRTEWDSRRCRAPAPPTFLPGEDFHLEIATSHITNITPTHSAKWGSMSGPFGG